MNKINFKNSRGLNLVGYYYPSDSKCAIIIAHGFCATKDRPRLIKASEEFSKAGFAVLNFDFGGCGESDEREITVTHQIADLKSAISYLKQEGYEKIGVLGESLGALTSILAYDDYIRALILWAPVTEAKTPSLIKREELKQELNEKGYIIYHKDSREFKIPKEYLEERQSVNQQEILSRITCPVLIIHGTEDKTIPLQHSQEAMQYLSEGSKLEIIEGAGHKLEEKIDDVISISLDWFKKHLKD